MLLRNPKKPTEEFETDLNEAQAVEILKTQLKNNYFAQSLLSAYPRLSAAQKYWLMKLAEDNRPDKKNKDYREIQLKSNLMQFIEPMGMVQFRLGLINISNNPQYEKLKEIGKLKFIWNTDTKVVDVFSGKCKVGYIENDKFYAAKHCAEIIIHQIIIFSAGPVLMLEIFGKLTGHCCVCGRFLTNEGSVKRGIGPICAEKYGI